MDPRQQKPEHDRDRMSHNRWSGLQLRRERLPNLTFHPGGAKSGAGIVFECVREINNRTATLENLPPVPASTLRIRSKERKVHVLELFGANALNESDFIFQRLELSERLVVIEELDLGRRKVSLIQNFGNFLPFEGSCAHDRHFIKASGRIRVGDSGAFDIRIHEGCEACVYVGGGGLPRRRKIHCNRQKTPENM